MGFPVICRLINTLLFDWLIRNRSGVSKRVCLVPSSETQGQSVESGEKARECFQAMAEEPLGTDSHRTISKRSSECWLLIGRMYQGNQLRYPLDSFIHLSNNWTQILIKMKVNTIDVNRRRPQDCSLRNAAGQRTVVRQMTFHEAFLITITQIGLKPIIGNALNAMFI